MQSNLTKSFPLFLGGGGNTTGRCARLERTGREKPYVKIRLEKLYEGQLEQLYNHYGADKVESSVLTVWNEIPDIASYIPMELNTTFRY